MFITNGYAKLFKVGFGLLYQIEEILSHKKIILCSTTAKCKKLLEVWLLFQLSWQECARNQCPRISSLSNATAGKVPDLLFLHAYNECQIERKWTTLNFIWIIHLSCLVIFRIINLFFEKFLLKYLVLVDSWILVLSSIRELS